VALAGVTLSLTRGATLAVFGSNGAGKTTLLRILATLLSPHAGSARVLGRELPREGWAVRGRIGLLAHDPLLYRDLTARENLRFHARLHRRPRARVEEVLDAVGMSARADDPIAELSRGMVQRLAIARTVLHEPELLLLDEPLAHLDPAAATQVQRLIGRASGGRRPRARPARRARGAAGPGIDRYRRPDHGALRVRQTVAALLAKELALELRTREAVPAMVLFSITTYVVFHFGLDRDRLTGDLAAGVLWVTLLFAAILGINRLFVADHEQGGFDGFLLAPVDRTALLVAKVIALFSFLCVVEVVAVPAFAVLLLGPGLMQAMPALLLVLVAANAGIAVVGTLVAALAIQTRARDLIVPLLALPLLIPAVLAAARTTTPLLAEGGAAALSGDWLAVLALYDLLFALIAYAVFDFLLED
jgi:heme exporter protein B